MILHANAKVNLTIEILGKRPDGYHEIRSVMRTLALHDTIRLEHAPELEVRCDVAALGGPDNLAYRAAQLLRQATCYTGGAHIALAKAIPVAAGLGGGSSDAATTLLGLNRLWDTGLDREELAGLAARLGSDVPFFLYGGTALAGGRGEQIAPLPDLSDCPVLLVHPPVSVSTAAIYQGVTPAHYTIGAASEHFAAVPFGTPPAAWPLVNALQPITVRAYPVVAEIITALQAGGALQALMCGSGSTCFGLFATPRAAEDGATRARARGWDAWVTHFA